MALGTTGKELAFYERVAASSPALTVVIRSDNYRILFASGLFKEYLGYAAHESMRILFTDLLESYEQDRFFSQLAAVKSGKRTAQDFVVYRLRTKNGETVPCYVFVSYMDGDGESISGDFQMLIMPDRSGGSIPYSSSDTKDLFLKHFEAEAYGTFEWLIAEDKVFWSAGIYKIYEVDVDVRDLNYQFVRQFLHPHDRDRVMNSTKRAIEKNSDIEMEFRIVTGRNIVKTLHSLGRMVEGGTNGTAKFIGSVRDVTRQREIEDHLKSKMDELSRSNRELEDFAYAASHDLQEPLRKITTFSDRLREKYKEPLLGEGEMYLSRMVASAENMRLLINGLLDFSRISRTKSPFAQVSLGVMIKQVLTDLELKIEETSTVINLGVLPVVDAEASQMKQLFTNLISNAMKFHRPGVAPIIDIRSVPLAANDLTAHGLPLTQEYHKITVSDNGIGFEPQYVSRIFQVFQRLHGKSEYPGSGVGLAICKKIMEHHKGVIFADGAKGAGATFTVIIPHRNL